MSDPGGPFREGRQGRRRCSGEAAEVLEMLRGGGGALGAQRQPGLTALAGGVPGLCLRCSSRPVSAAGLRTSETFSFMRRPDCVALSLLPLMPLSLLMLLPVA